MRSLYEPIDRKKRASQYHANAEECRKAGYRTLAQVNHEIAEMLDPPEPEDENFS